MVYSDFTLGNRKPLFQAERKKPQDSGWSAGSKVLTMVILCLLAGAGIEVMKGNLDFSDPQGYIDDLKVKGNEMAAAFKDMLEGEKRKGPLDMEMFNQQMEEIDELGAAINNFRERKSAEQAEKELLERAADQFEEPIVAAVQREQAVQHEPEPVQQQEHQQPEPVHHEPVQHEPVQHEPVQEEPEPVQQEPAQHEPVHEEPIHHEPEPVQQEPTPEEIVAKRHEILSAFMFTHARVIPPEEQPQLREFIMSVMNNFKVESQLPDNYEAARRHMFSTLQASEDGTGALLWVLAHWDVNKMPADWKEWVEVNIANAPPLHTILQGMHDHMADPAAVNGAIETFELFYTNQWALQVGRNA